MELEHRNAREELLARGTERLVRQAVEAERAAYAELVRAAGCNCETAIRRHGRPWATPSERAPHYEDCPIALAAAIEARKEG